MCVQVLGGMYPLVTLLDACLHGAVDYSRAVISMRDTRSEVEVGASAAVGTTTGSSTSTQHLQQFHFPPGVLLPWSPPNLNFSIAPPALLPSVPWALVRQALELLAVWMTHPTTRRTAAYTCTALLRTLSDVCGACGSDVQVRAANFNLRCCARFLSDVQVGQLLLHCIHLKRCALKGTRQIYYHPASPL